MHHRLYTSSSMYARSLHRSLTLAAGVTVAGAFAARAYRHQHQKQEEEEQGRRGLQQHFLLLPSSSASASAHPRPYPSFFSRHPTDCAAAAAPEYHSIPLPPTDGMQTQVHTY